MYLKEKFSPDTRYPVHQKSLGPFATQCGWVSTNTWFHELVSGRLPVCHPEHLTSMAET